MMRIIFALLFLFIIPVGIAYDDILERRTETSKTFETGRYVEGRPLLQSFIYEIPMHYKINYSNGTEIWKEINQFHFDEYSDYYEYDEMPIVVRIFKNQTGYEIKERKTGAKHRVLMHSVDGFPMNLWENNDDMKITYEVSQFGVRLWKHIYTDNAPKRIRYLVSSYGEGSLPFREVPEAFLIDDKNKKISIPVEKKIIDENTFFWDEYFPQTGISVDTDIYIGSVEDAYIFGFDGTYSTARATSTGITTTSGVQTGQFFTSGESTGYQISRGFFRFATNTFDICDIVNSTNLTFTIQDDQSATDFEVHIVRYHWIFLSGQREESYDTCLTEEEDDNIWINTSGKFVDTPYSSGLLEPRWINPGSQGTKYCLRSSGDESNSTPTGNEYVVIYSSDWGGNPAYLPNMSITYTDRDLQVKVINGINETRIAKVASLPPGYMEKINGLDKCT